MAAPIKKGLDYFPFEINLFNDKKIRRLIRAFSTKGFAFYSFLLCEIYKDNGYFIKWDDDLAFEVSDVFKIDKENTVKEVVNFCCSVGLFDKKLLNDENILTSSGIQKRYISIATKAKRSDRYIKKEYDLINSNIDNSQDNRVNSELTLINTEETLINSELNPQRKEKKSKEKKRKENSDFIFSEILNLYQGTKKDFATEFENFKIQFKDWDDLLDLILPALQKQNVYRDYCKRSNIFIPHPKHFKNWIKERCWEESVPDIPKDESGYIQWKGNPTEDNFTDEEKELYRKFEAGEF